MRLRLDSMLFPPPLLYCLDRTSSSLSKHIHKSVTDKVYFPTTSCPRVYTLQRLITTFENYATEQKTARRDGGRSNTPQTHKSSFTFPAVTFVAVSFNS